MDILKLSKILKMVKNNKSVFESSPFKSYLKQFSGDALECFARGKSLLLVYIDIKDFHVIEQINGPEPASRLLKQMGNILGKKAPEMIPPGEDILAVDKLLGDEFIVVYSQNGLPSREELQNICISWRIGFREALNRALYGEVGIIIDIHVGCASIEPQGSGNVDYKIYLECVRPRTTPGVSWTPRMLVCLRNLEAFSKARGLE